MNTESEIKSKREKLIIEDEFEAGNGSDVNKKGEPTAVPVELS